MCNYMGVIFSHNPRKRKADAEKPGSRARLGEVIYNGATARWRAEMSRTRPATVSAASIGTGHASSDSDTRPAPDSMATRRPGARARRSTAKKRARSAIATPAAVSGA